MNRLRPYRVMSLWLGALLLASVGCAGVERNRGVERLPAVPLLSRLFSRQPPQSDAAQPDATQPDELTASPWQVNGGSPPAAQAIAQLPYHQAATSGPVTANLVYLQSSQQAVRPLDYQPNVAPAAPAAPTAPRPQTP